MTMNNDSEVIACHDDVDDIPSISYDFRPLSEVETKEKNELMGTIKLSPSLSRQRVNKFYVNKLLLDVMGVVKSSEDVISLTSRNTGKEVRKRDIHIVDMSNCEVNITLNFSGSVGIKTYGTYISSGKFISISISVIHDITKSKGKN